MWGRRRPRQALRLIDHLPGESATVARMLTDRRNRRSSRRGEPWREVYGRTPRDVLMDLWELTAQVNSDKRRHITYPDPTRKR